MEPEAPRQVVGGCDGYDGIGFWNVGMRRVVVAWRDCDYECDSVWAKRGDLG